MSAIVSQKLFIDLSLSKSTMLAMAIEQGPLDEGEETQEQKPSLLRGLMV